MPETMEKAEIVKVGGFNNYGQPVGWTFDHTNQSQHVAAISVIRNEVYYSGYSIEDLKDIAPVAWELRSASFPHRK